MFGLPKTLKLSEVRLATPKDVLYTHPLPIPIHFVGEIRLPRNMAIDDDREISQAVDSTLRVYIYCRTPEGAKYIRFIH